VILADKVMIKIGDAFYPVATWLRPFVNLATAANKFLYTTAVNTYAEADITSYGRSLVAASGQTATLFVEIDGGGSTITTGVKRDVIADFGFTITGWTLLGDQSGSIVIDIWKDTLANYPPTVADTITASAKPTLSTATNNQSSTLTGWTTTVAANDCLRFNVDSITTLTRAVLALKVTKTSV